MTLFNPDLKSSVPVAITTVTDNESHDLITN